MTTAPSDSNNFINLTVAALGLIGVVIGGAITIVGNCVTNSIISNRTQRIQMRDSYLIPLCTAIEDTYDQFKNNIEPTNLPKNLEFCDNSKRVLMFLKAKNRVYLDKKSKYYLEKYDEAQSAFEQKLTESRNKIICIINSEVDKMSNSFPIDVSSIERYELLFTGDCDGKIEDAILSKLPFRLMDIVDSILVINDEEFGPYALYEFGSGLDEKVQELRSMGLEPDSDNPLCDEVQLSKAFYVPILKGVQNAEKIVSSEYKNYDFSGEYSLIINTLKTLKDHVTEYIEKITKY